MATPNYELSATAATWVGDILCGPGGGEPPTPPPFDPGAYLYVRWVGNVNYASFDGNTSTPYFQDTGLFTSNWTALNTVSGVRDVVGMINTEPNILPYSFEPWRASGVYEFDPAVYPINRYSNPVSVRKYNPNSPSPFTDYLSPGFSLAAFSPGYPPSTLVLHYGIYVYVNETDARVVTYAGNFQFSNDGSTVVATWEGL